MADHDVPGPLSAARRTALKTLAVATGISVLPVHWSKAGLQFGTLPAHAQATGFHTILCAADVELEPDSDQLVSSCTIAPAQAGIVMHYEIAFTNAEFETTGDASGDVPTDGSGTASVTTAAIHATFGSGQVLFTWTFSNPGDGDGSCTQRYFWGTPA